MQISELSLHNFRNHENLHLSFPKGATTIVGRNGRGKTNIVEAVHYLATLGSHRVSQDAPLIRSGQNSATISAKVEKHNRQAQVELAINFPGANKVSLNTNPLTKTRDILGLVTTVIFSPEDLDLVKGEPSARRRFIDELSTLLAPKFSSTRSDFERTLKQRNTLLKSLGRRTPSTQARATLDAWDEQLIQSGHAAHQMTRPRQRRALRVKHIRTHGAKHNGRQRRQRHHVATHTDGGRYRRRCHGRR